MKNYHHLTNVFILIMCLLVASCSGGHYDFQLFSFPNTTKAYNDDWEYLLSVSILTNHKGLTKDQGPKKVIVKIVDKEKRKLLLDKIKIDAGYAETKGRWSKFEDVQLWLYANSSDNPIDHSNPDPNQTPFLTLRYQFDPKTGKFKRTEIKKQL